MRIRKLLVTATVGALVAGVTGLTGPAAHAATAPSSISAGTLTTWGDAGPSGVPDALNVPTDLSGPVLDVAASSYATAVVTSAGHLRVWGKPDSLELGFAPTGITDAVAVSMAVGCGVVLHDDGSVTGWGSGTMDEVPEGLKAKAIGVGGSTGYAVKTDGTLATWGNAPATAPPTGLTDLVDISIGSFGSLALHEDGTVTAWGANFGTPGNEFNTVPDLGGKKAVQVATAAAYDGVVLEDGTIVTWGPFGVPENQPDLTNKFVKSLSMGSSSVAAVVEDKTTGAPSVELWGSTDDAAMNAPEHEEALAGKPVTEIALGQFHAAALTTTFREVAKPTITGAPKVGQTLTATPATYSLAPDAAATGQWFAGEEAIAGQTGTTLTLDDTLVGKSISYHNAAIRDDVTVNSVSDAAGPVVAKTNATVTVSAAKGAYGKASTVTVSVPGATGDVNLTVDGKSVGTKALASGKASFSVVRTTNPGNHALMASYAGSDTYSAATKAATLLVAKGATGQPALKVSASHKKRGTVKVSVATSVGLVKATGRAQLVLKKGKSTKKVNLNVKNGTATGKVPKLAKGTWTAYVIYKGDAYYVAVKSKTIKVKSK